MIKKCIFISLIAIATPISAHDGVTDPGVKARMKHMVDISLQTQWLRQMIGEKRTFSQSFAQSSVDGLIANSAQIASHFEGRESDPKSEAKAEIWSNWEDFSQKAMDLELAAKGVDASSLQSLKATFQPVLIACKGCHDDYRAKKH